MTAAARYDEIADWYVRFTGAWDVGPLALLPDGVLQQRVLDLACGYGQVSRHMARIGAEVTGVDLSANLVQRAEALDRAQPLGSRSGFAIWSATCRRRHGGTAFVSTALSVIWP